ncbi:MAG: TetR/AcrR family transcriptional regulator [Nocardioides sp.]
MRTAILEAAADLLREHRDVDKVSIDAVVRAVGCTPPTLYYYFPTKTDLLVQVCLREYDAFATDLQAASAGGGDPVETLHRRGEAYLRWAREHPAHYRLLFMTELELPGEAPPVGPDGLPDFRGVPGLGDLVRDLEVAQAAGLPIVDPNLDAFTLWGIVHGFASLSITEHAVPVELLIWGLRRASSSMFGGGPPDPTA